MLTDLKNAFTVELNNKLVQDRCYNSLPSNLRCVTVSTLLYDIQNTKYSKTLTFLAQEHRLLLMFTEIKKS